MSNLVKKILNISEGVLHNDAKVLVCLLLLITLKFISEWVFLMKRPLEITHGTLVNNGIFELEPSFAKPTSEESTDNILSSEAYNYIFENEAFVYINSLLTSCDNEKIIIRPAKDVGFGLSLTEILQLVNVVLSKGMTPIFETKNSIWLSGDSVSIQDLLNLPCRIENIERKQREKIRILRCTGICPVEDTLARVWLPEEYVFLGYKWWYGQLAKALVKPSPVLLQRLHDSTPLKNSQIRNHLFKNDETSLVGTSPFSTLFNLSSLQRPLIAIHLRRGDSCTNIRPACIRDITLVLEKLKQQGVTSGSLLVATEAENLLEEIKEEYKAYNFSALITFKLDRSLYESLYQKRIIPIEDIDDLEFRIKNTDIVLEALLDIALLSMGDIHVGSFYSNFIRIGMSLSKQSAIKTSLKYITFDASFCPFESCQLGWLSKRSCPRWHKHFCQWRSKEYCQNLSKPSLMVKNCGILAGSSCSINCFLFMLSKRTYKIAAKKSNSFLPPRIPENAAIINNTGFWKLLEQKFEMEPDLYNTVRTKLLKPKTTFWKEQLNFLTYPYYFSSHVSLQDILIKNELCCTNDCRSESFLFYDKKKVYGPHCSDIQSTMLKLNKFLNQFVFNNKLEYFIDNVRELYSKENSNDSDYRRKVAPPCDHMQFIYSSDSSEQRLERARIHEYDFYGPEDISQLFHIAPAENCNFTYLIPIYDKIKARVKKSSSVIVYLAQKRHSSYDTNSLSKLKKSLKLLYKNFNSKYQYDVIIFHSGDFDNKADIADLRFVDGQNRQEIHLVELKGKFWQVPGFLMHTKEKDWEDEQFSTGYRNMCRWYAGLLFEFVDQLGYDYVMRFDEDSYLLSPISYDIFEYMKRNRYQYGFRQDAIEPCCNLDFRDATINKILSLHQDLPNFGFYNKIRESSLAKSNIAKGFYGYYNNFFVTRVKFWTRPEVRKIFNFLDRTGTFYIDRENDLFTQSFIVQLFMAKSEVKKFVDFSYQHITGFENNKCAWGGLSIGFQPGQNKTEELEDHIIQVTNLRGVVINKNKFEILEGIYCTKSNFQANSVINYHKFEFSAMNGCFNVSTEFVKNDIMRVSVMQQPFLMPVSETHPGIFNLKVAQSSSKLRNLLQNTTSCAIERDLNNILYMEPPECGIGCTISFMIKPLLYAIKHEMKIAVPGSLWLRGEKPTNFKDCKTFSCLFKNFANNTCTKSIHKQFIKRSVNQDDVEFFDSLSFQNLGSDEIFDDAKSNGVFWYVANMVRFILEPSFLLSNHISNVVKELDLTNTDYQPVLALHVRMGDSCSDPKKHEKGRNCDTIESYLPYVRDLVSEFGFKSVYLATDSLDAVEFVKTKKPLNVKWLVNEAVDRRKYRVFDEAKSSDELSIEGILFGNKKLRDAGFTPFTEFLEFMTDLLIIGDYTQGLVGKFTSNMDRIAAALLATKYDQDKCYRPLVSIDSFWCADFMVKSGTSFDGRSFYC